MRMKGQFRVFVGFLLLITIGFVRASEENYGTILSEQFKMEVLPRGGFRLEMLMKSSSRSVLPEFIPAQGLNGLAAIPFLLEVLDNGYKLPDEGEEYEGKEVKKRYIFPYANQPEKQKQLTRMYAALCLGAIGDKRAFVPLVSLLSKENKLDDDYYIKYYVATALGYLNDPNSVPYLINVMESVDNTDLQFACMRSLAEYRDMRVIVPILNVFDKKPGAFDIKSIMEFMTKKKIVMTHSKDEKLLKKFMEDRDYGYYRTHKKEVFYFEEFPELEPFSTYPGFEKVWQHWLEAGGQRTAKQFRVFYDEYKKVRTESKENQGDIQLRAVQKTKAKLLNLGIAAIPFMVNEVYRDDLSMIPLISNLTNGDLAEDATQPECLEWWGKTKERWLIPFDDQSYLDELEMNKTD